MRGNHGSRNYNECTHYLLTHELRSEQWLRAYQSLRGRFCEHSNVDWAKKRTGVYSFDSNQLDPDKYMMLTKDCRVSVVTNTEVPFLGIADMVRPTVAMDRGQALEVLDCEFLRPDASLYAYGPMIHDLRCLPGAPSLRVAGCLGNWGLPIEQCLDAVVATFENDRSLLIVQPEEGLRRTVDERIVQVLEAEVILADAAG